jgi:hypothetical protein
MIQRGIVVPEYEEAIERSESSSMGGTLLPPSVPKEERVPSY